MRVLYTSDNGAACERTTLGALIALFDETESWFQGHNADDMWNELTSRGWYEGLHQNGRYLVLNMEKFGLRWN